MVMSAGMVIFFMPANWSTATLRNKMAQQTSSDPLDLLDKFSIAAKEKNLKSMRKIETNIRDLFHKINPPNNYMEDPWKNLWKEVLRFYSVPYICPHCDTFIENVDEVFCPNCGTKIEKN